MPVTPKIKLYASISTLPNNETTSPYSRVVAYVLTYRGIDFEYESVLLHNVQFFAPTLGAKPTTTHTDGSAKYTLPIIVDTTNPDAPVTVTDSLEILKYLEKTYPDPSRPIFATPDAPASELLFAQGLLGVMFTMFQGILMKDAVTDLVEEDRDWFFNKLLGGVDPASTVHPVGSDAYVNLLNKTRGELTKIAALLAAQSTPWLGGEKPVYADFTLLVVLGAFKRLGGAIWTEDFAKIDGGRLVKFYEAGEQQYNRF